MGIASQERVLELLRQMPEHGLAAAKQLFWTELNYDYVNLQLSDREWPDRTREVLAEPPMILAQHESEFGAFHVIYVRLREDQRGRGFPLSLTAERLAITQLLSNHPYSLFLFTRPDEKHWHFVNVRFDNGEARRRVFRRIAVGPHERLRTSSERIAMLDLASLSPDLFGLSPIAIQQRHDDAFDVEAVTKEFFHRFARQFYRVRDEIASVPDLAGDADVHAQTLLDRLLFLYFIQKKGWLAQERDYLYTRFEAHHADHPDDLSYYGQVVYPLFVALSDREANRDMVDAVGQVPFLNGGLFELPLTSAGTAAAQARLPVSNATFAALFEDLLEHYNFTISEDSPLDQEVAIDPEMLGKIFEIVVLEREQDPGVDLRKATGSYYTPRSVVAFMCREALSEYLATRSGMERERIAELLDLPPADQLTNEEQERLRDLFTRAEAEGLKALLLSVRACDPAVGSGAFLLGLLQTIAWAVELLDWLLEATRRAERNYAYDLKKEIIERCLYGVDIQAQAVRICELRLWLSLVVDHELPEHTDFSQAIREVPALPNLAYKVRPGDSILERLFGAVVQLDVLAREREAEQTVEMLESEKAAYFRLDDTREKRRRELRILELQCSLAERLLQAKKLRLGGYQRPLETEETAKQRRAREVWEAREREFDELTARVEQARGRARELLRRTDTRGLSAQQLRDQLLGDAQYPTFLWRIDFAEVFKEKGGFDVMIANPPYIRQEKISWLKEELKRLYPEVYHGVADLYAYFYAQALRQLREGGTLVFISSNKFMRAGYGRALRRTIGEDNTLLGILDFGDLPVFESTAYPTVVVARKAPPNAEHSFSALTVDDISALARLPDVVREQSWIQAQDSLRVSGWDLVRPELQALTDQLSNRGLPLSKYLGGRVYRGITTGLNKAFVIDQRTRSSLLAADPGSGEIIKPWIRGRDIDRWRVMATRLYLLWTYRGIAINEYPAVLEYLSRFRDDLAGRWEPRHGQCQWYELRPCQYYGRFETPKIVYPDIAKKPEFAYDTSGSYGGNTMYIIPTDDLYLLGVLNSSTIAFLYPHLASRIRGDYLRFIASYMEQLPIPDPTTDHRASVSGLVRSLLSEGLDEEARRQLECDLNRMVYEVYRLNQEEISLLEDDLATRARRRDLTLVTGSLEALTGGEQ